MIGMLHLGIVSSLEKVLPQKGSRGEKCAGFSALDGETLSFQAVFSNEQGGLYRFRAVTDGEAELACYFVRNVAVDYVTYPAAEADEGYISHEAGVYPHLLEPARTEYVYAAPVCRALWITVKGRPGIHTVRVVFTDRSGEETAVSAQIRVSEARLPEQELIVTQWFHTDCIAAYYGYEIFSEDLWRMVRKFLRMARENGINMILTPLFTPALDTAVGHRRPTVQLVGIRKDGEEYAFDFTLLRRWVALCKEEGFAYFEMPHLFAQWGADATPGIVAEAEGKLQTIFGWDTRVSSPEYRRFLSLFLPALKEELNGLGILDHTYFHISDESSPAVRSAEYEAAAPFLQGCKIIDATDRACSQRQMGIPVYGTAALAKEGVPEGEAERWCYYCGAGEPGTSNRLIAMPSSRNRSIGVQLYKAKMQGFLHWGYNFYFSALSLFQIDPFLDPSAGGAFPAGDAFSVYPGKDGPLPTVSLFVFREALQDLRALKLLEQRLGYEGTVELIEGILGGEITFGRCFPADRLTAMREEINDRIGGFAPCP